MRVEYDSQANALYIYLQENRRVAQTREIEDGLIVDLDKSGKVIGIEILDVKERMGGKKVLQIPIKDISKEKVLA